MLIAYEPNGDVLTITVAAAPPAQTQMQGTVSVGFDATGNVVSVAVPNASSVLWEHGGQVAVMLPQAAPAVVVAPVAVAPVVVAPVAVAPVAVAPASATIVETTRVVERPAL